MLFVAYPLGRKIQERHLFHKTVLLCQCIDKYKGIAYHDFLTISDKEHVKKIMQMPVHFLLKSGNGFFVEKAGVALALRDDLQEIIADSAFVEHMKDAIEYRTMDYYQRRYREQE